LRLGAKIGALVEGVRRGVQGVELISASTAAVVLAGEPNAVHRQTSLGTHTESRSNVEKPTVGHGANRRLALV